MKVVGIICEYNPFHKGHAYQLSAARERTGAEYVVCVMSGAFVQRGEPAIVDKWTRAEMALCNGADVVLELPALFSVRAAQDFAFGGVSLLSSLSVVTHLSFGAETEHLSALLSLASPESPELSQRIRDALSKGLSYPAALQNALGCELLPNDTLAVEYLRALQKLSSPIAPVLIHREDAHNGSFSSSAIRRAISAGESYAALVPENAFSPLQNALPRELPTLDGFSQALLYLLRTTPPESIASRFSIPEGLENRLCDAAFETDSLAVLLQTVKSRRYSEARLKRLLVQLLLGLDSALVKNHPAPEYARVLGFKRTAAPLLRLMQARSCIPVIQKVADAPLTPLLHSDLNAQNLWDLLSGAPAHRDFTEKIRIL